MIKTDEVIAYLEGKAERSIEEDRILRSLIKMRDGGGMTVSEFFNASQSCVCEVCGKQYGSHPMYAGLIGFHGEPYLNILCTGELVKL